LEVSLLSSSLVSSNSIPLFPLLTHSLHSPSPSLLYITHHGPHTRYISLSTSSLVAIPSPTAGVISEPSVSSSRPGSVPSSSLSSSLSFRSSLTHTQHAIANASPRTHRRTKAALNPMDHGTIEVLERRYSQWEQNRARRRQS
jgi:hypothetical protein